MSTEDIEDNPVSNEAAAYSEAGKRDLVIQIQVNKREREEIASKAAAKHLSVSSYCRQCALDMPDAGWMAITK